ncbi:unnamed protein product [Cyprideis torosa]|uniref:Uncharacterized protein n=1 Tax=Cyprideis torosa TaxID=163714 RepID=A0A7R8W5X3_9CRUS|nr:unnamed protein product [Cyprideis torosa]CAG0881925.1 unnamed protein product [Cyprideis torosa]
MEFINVDAKKQPNSSNFGENRPSFAISGFTNLVLLAKRVDFRCPFPLTDTKQALYKRLLASENIWSSIWSPSSNPTQRDTSQPSSPPARVQSGGDGTIRDAGGAFGKLEQAREEVYFRKIDQEQLKALKQHLEEEVEHHLQEIQRHEDAIQRHQERIGKLQGVEEEAEEGETEE